MAKRIVVVGAPGSGSTALCALLNEMGVWFGATFKSSAFNSPTFEEIFVDEIIGNYYSASDPMAVIHQISTALYLHFARNEDTNDPMAVHNQRLVMFPETVTYALDPDTEDVRVVFADRDFNDIIDSMVERFGASVRGSTLRSIADSLDKRTTWLNTGLGFAYNFADINGDRTMLVDAMISDLGLTVDPADRTNAINLDLSGIGTYG